MNVQQLIERLKEFPPGLPVWTNGGGDPYLMGPVEHVSVEAIPEGMRPLPNAPHPPEQWVQLG